MVEQQTVNLPMRVRFSPCPPKKIKKVEKLLDKATKVWYNNSVIKGKEVPLK